MLYRFGSFELDLAKAELRAEGVVRSVEPQVFALLALLIENRARLVSKEEIIEKVWDGRVVSDAALASRVKSARQALDDDGKAQRYIKTLNRLGFRFVAEVQITREPSAQLDRASNDVSATDNARSSNDSVESRPSVAVLPFDIGGADARFGALATALPDELITELSRLRWLFVTARGSSFRVSGTQVDFGNVGRLLGVRYCVCGTIEVFKKRLDINVKLVDTRDAGIVWAEHFSGNVDDIHSMRADIRSRVLVALDIRIPMHEAALARQIVSEDLDAWSAYHLGLQHIYRFNRNDNALATRLFQRAVSLDPYFARAYAGLSFVYFQNAFLRYDDDVAAAIVETRRFAERGVELDPLDPFVNFTMGRSFWLNGNLEDSFSWLERATSVSPNYAQGIYTRGVVETLAGQEHEGRAHVDLAMRLSPIDPLYYAMMATRAFTHLFVGEHDEAVNWAERGARAPGAHVLIAMIAALACQLGGDQERADWWAANVRERNASLGQQDFFRAFPVKAANTRQQLSQALARLRF